MAVDVQFALRGSPPLAPEQIAGWADSVLERMGEERTAVDACIRIVGEAESKRLNATYRGVDKPTNVLSFPSGATDPHTGGKALGDIIICDPVVRREAQDQGKRLRDHYAHMVVHGMLHLFGYDHVDPLEADSMEDTEREILGRFGIADPYGVG